jgi:hypothetical protein
VRKIYRVYVLGETPSNLKETIARLHAAGILKGKGEDIPLHSQGLNLHNGKEPKNKVREIKK